MAEAVVEKSDFLSLHSLLDTTLKCPNQHENVAKEFLHVFKETDINLKCLRTTLAFHKPLRPAAVFILERRLLASGILHEGNMAKPCLSSVLSRILFGVVTASSTECADYCASVWIERYVEPHSNGCNMLASNSQHCWMLHVASLCTPCWKFLRVVGGRCAKFETGQTFSYVQMDTTTPNIVFWGQQWVDLATGRERQLTMGKRAERTKHDFRCPICRSAIGQTSCLICACCRQLTFLFCF